MFPACDFKAQTPVQSQSRVVLLHMDGNGKLGAGGVFLKPLQYSLSDAAVPESRQKGYVHNSDCLGSGLQVKAPGDLLIQQDQEKAGILIHGMIVAVLRLELLPQEGAFLFFAPIIHQIHFIRAGGGVDLVQYVEVI
jgi:hypothetical protein